MNSASQQFAEKCVHATLAALLLKLKCSFGGVIRESTLFTPGTNFMVKMLSSLGLKNQAREKESGSYFCRRTLAKLKKEPSSSAFRSM